MQCAQPSPWAITASSGDTAAVNSGGSVMGHGNRLINKVLHDFTISGRGRRGGNVLSVAGAYANTHVYRSRWKGDASQWGTRSCNSLGCNSCRELAVRTQPGLLILLQRGIMGSHDAGLGVRFYGFHGRTAAVPSQPSRFLQHSLTHLHPSLWEHYLSFILPGGQLIRLECVLHLREGWSYMPSQTRHVWNSPASDRNV